MTTFLSILTASLSSVAMTLMGAAGNLSIWGTITRSDVAVAGFYLLFTAIITIATAGLVGRSARKSATHIDSVTSHRLFTASGRPLYALIVLCGLYAAASPIVARVRSDDTADVIQNGLDFLFQIIAFATIFWFLFRATRVLEGRLAQRVAARPGKTDELLVPLLGSSLRVIVIILAIILGIPLLKLPVEYAGFISKLTSMILIISIAALLVRMVAIVQGVVLARFDMSVADNLRARKVYTQIHVISRVVYVTIALFAISAVLMLFQEVRHVGTSLLASAGIVGIIAGVAAQKTLANLFAGFQIALAQPVRQDDVVVVEGEWGRVEEITLTYVIVHIWDDRRLVLPLSYFIEKPFQNWTRTSSAIMGSVLISVDYSFPVNEARTVLKDIVENSPLWDKRFWNLQVSDSTETTLQLRVLATSSDSSRSWDLRCEIREKFIAYLQSRHPESLPRIRGDIIARQSQSHD